MDIEYCDRLFSDHFFQSEDQCAGNGFRIHGSLLSWDYDRIFSGSILEGSDIFGKYSIGHGLYVLSGNSTNLTISHRL